MNKYIDSKKLIAEIKRQIESAAQKADISYSVDDVENEKKYDDERNVLERLLGLITSLQQEPRFPQYDNIVDKVFGAGNLESFEYRDAEMLVALAKEELLKSLQQEQTPTEREIAEAHRYAEMIREKDKARIQQEQPEPSNNLVDVDAVREDFITEVYRVLDADPTNDRANAIIDAFDSLPTVSQEQPEDVVVVARAFLDVLSKTPYNNKPITDAQVIIRQLLLFFENPKEYNPDAIVEQPEVDFKEELDDFISEFYRHYTEYEGQYIKEKDWRYSIEMTALHFYGLRNRVLEEAARHVYESWIGGTMDDVRRDMVELGKVLNARKEVQK